MPKRSWLPKGEILPHEHCWHSDNRLVIRDGVNIHGPFCVTHPDIHAEHTHSIQVHRKKCCRCGTVKTSYDEYIDTGEKETKKK